MLKTKLTAALFVTLTGGFISNVAHAVEYPQTVEAYFSPPSIEYGGRSRLSWQANNENIAKCTLSGDGFANPQTDLEPSGFRYLSATSDRNIKVTCGFGTWLKGEKELTLKVKPLNIEVKYEPSTIVIGGSSKLIWSAPGADSCTSTGASSVHGASGEVVFNGDEIGEYSTTLRCTRNNSTSTKTVSVNVIDHLPPIVNAYFSPSYLSQPGTTWFTWSSIAATQCSKGGSSGSIPTYVSYSMTDWVTCYGPGGSSTGFAHVTVNRTGGKEPGPLKTITQASSISEVIDNKLNRTFHRLTGKQLVDSSMTILEVKLNNDDKLDVLVHDGDTKVVYLFLSEEKELKLVRVIPQVSSISELDSIQMIKVDDSQPLQLIINKSINK